MGRSLIAALALAGLAAPMALGAPGGVHGAPATHPASSGAHPVAFVARGVIKSLDPAASSVVIEVRGGNRFVRDALAGAPSPRTLALKVDAETAIDASTTRITKAGKGRAAFADLAAKDRVVVMWAVPRGTALTSLQLLDARRVVDTGAAAKPSPRA
jgi:hypothetical protein